MVRLAKTPIAVGLAATALLAGGSVLGYADPADALPGGTSVSGATAIAPNWPAGECVLSDPHLVFDDQSSSNPKVDLSWNSSTATPVDPSNANFHLRNTEVGITNLSAHTYYETTYFASWFYLAQNQSTNWNFAPWNSATDLFDTQVPPAFSWATGWEPRDTATPGAQITLNPGVIAGNPLPPVIISPEQLGKMGMASGATRPGYVLPDIEPGVNQGFTQTFRIERPTNTGAYATLQFRVVSVETCLPEPSIAQAIIGDSELHGTGTTVGDAITVTDQGGNVLGTATVQSNLSWSITLSGPLDGTVTSLTATAVDEFSFEGSADTTLAPLPVLPEEVTPLSPRVIDPSECGAEQSFETTPVTGVTYTQVRIGDMMRFVASADEGYVLAADAQSVWEFEIAAVVRCETDIETETDLSHPNADDAADAPLVNTGAADGGLHAGLGVALALLAGGALMLILRRSSAG